MNSFLTVLNQLRSYRIPSEQLSSDERFSRVKEFIQKKAFVEGISFSLDIEDEVERLVIQKKIFRAWYLVEPENAKEGLEILSSSVQEELRQEFYIQGIFKPFQTLQMTPPISIYQKKISPSPFSRSPAENLETSTEIFHSIKEELSDQSEEELKVLANSLEKSQSAEDVSFQALGKQGEKNERNECVKLPTENPLSLEYKSLIEKIKEFNHEIQIHSFRIIDNYIIKNSVNLKNNYIPDFLIEAFHELRNSPDEKKRLFAFELRKYIKDPVLLDQVDKYFEKILLQDEK